MLGSFHTNKKSVESQIMRKFVNSQRLKSAEVLANSELLSVLSLKQQPTSTLADFSMDDENSLALLNMSLRPLNSISFQNNSVVNILPPFHEDVFSSELQKDLKMFYTQLYPDCTIEKVSPFFIRCGRAVLCGQLIGSVMNATSSNSSFVIAAYWPSSGHNLSSIDYGARMKIGTVQYFCKNQTTVCTSDNVKHNYEHVLAYVCWKQRHPHEEWYGISATVCVNMHEPPSVASFIPVQRINSVCVYSVVDTEIDSLLETVFIAVPIPAKLCL